MSSIKVFDLERDKYEYYIHQINFYDQNLPSEKPRLLMIHGFGGTGSIFYSAVKHLREEFRITTIDLLGMGASGRPQTFLPSNCEECYEYFLLSIKAWMEETGYDQDHYHLLGHSLGGHLATLYSTVYPQNIKSLILASPVGVPH